MNGACRTRMAWGACLLLALLAMLAQAAPALAATYYVSPTGNDQATGTSSAKAWRSLDRVASSSLRAGDVVRLERGGVWRESLGIPSSGITLTTYGAGSAPVISGADVVFGFTPGLVDGAQIWVAPLAAQPTQVFVNGVRGQRVASVKEADSEGKWHWADGELAVHWPMDGEPRVEASLRKVVLHYGENDNVVVDGLRIERAAETCVSMGTGSGNVIRNSVVADAFVKGIRSSGEAQHDNGRIEDNEILGCGAEGILLDGRMTGWIIQRNVVHDCCQLHYELVGGHPQQEWSGAIKIWGWDTAGYVGALTIQHNHVYNIKPQFSEGSVAHKRYVGIWLDEVVDPTSRPLVVRNRIGHVASRGIFIEKSSNVDVLNNILNRCASIKYCGAIQIEGNYDRGAHDNQVMHNTIYGGWWGIAVKTYEANGLYNNVIRNNIITDTEAERLYAVDGGDNDGARGWGNVYEFNCLGSEAPGFARFGSSCSTYDCLDRLYKRAMHNARGDPLLVDPAGGDFRLRPGSPCIGAGKPSGAAKKGSRLVRADAPDVGALEHVGSGLGSADLAGGLELAMPKPIRPK